MRVDGHIWKVKEWLIPLTVNDVLVVANNVEALLHHIHALICVMTQSKDT
jgi:hypothetical protein